MALTRNLLPGRRVVSSSPGSPDRRLLDALARTTPHAVYLVDMDASRVVCANRPVLRELGHEVPNELPLAAWADHAHPDDRNRLRGLAAEWALLGDDEVREGEHRLRRADGAYHWFLCRETVLARHPDGAVSQVLGTLVDITDRKHEAGDRDPLTAAGHTESLDLGTRVEDRLCQSQKLQAIGQLAGGVAHDFNNLLTIIRGYADVLLSELDPADPLVDAARHISEAGERAAMLTRQLLLFGRTAVVEPGPLDLNAVIENTGTMLRRLIGEDVAVVTSLAPGLSRARIDRGQIEQVIVNLCLNSRDALPEGGDITIETHGADFDEHDCRLRPTHRPGRFVELVVRDTGTGMTPDVKARLFEPFFTTKDPARGTGLGLATVAAVVQRAGGFVTVESEPGSGATFRVYVPADDTPVLPTAVPPPAAPAIGRETVLLVEDEDEVRELARLSLEKHGYTVLATGNGIEALALADDYPGEIDLLLTDVVLAGMNGREIAERLRGRRPQLRVLFMSGYNDDDVERRGVVGGPSAFLQKPFGLTSIARRVGEVLSQAA